MKIALTVGVFDMFHEGHANLFKQMRAEADCVAVIVHDDFSTFQNKKRFPVQATEHRWRNITLCGLVDHVFTTSLADPSSSIESTYQYLKNHYGPGTEFIYVRADDWPQFPGRATIEKLGVPIKLVPYTKGISSSKLRSEL